MVFPSSTEMKKTYDLTLTLTSHIPVFPGQPPLSFLPWSNLKVHGNATNAFFMVEHTGTHLDAPAHFIEGGKTVEEIPLERFWGEALVLDVSSYFGRGELKLPDLEKILGEKDIEEGDIVLFYSGADKLLGRPEYFTQGVYLTESVAEFLIDKKVKGVGIDSPSIDSQPFAVHRLLLAREIIIYESLTNLGELRGKRVIFAGFPLKLQGCTGSPIRAIALCS